MSSSRLAGAKDEIGRRLHALEQHPILGFPISSYRRFQEIEGKQLALVIAANMFVAVIPLFIIAYAIIEAFNPQRSFAVIIIERFHLSGESADQVRAVFSSAKSGRNLALAISVGSLLITGFDVAAAVQTAYARAFRMTPLRGLQKYSRGALWFATMLFVTGLALTLRYWTQSRPWWFFALVAPLILSLNFTLFFVTPRLVLDLPFRWVDLVPGAAICTLVSIVVNAVSVLLMRNWLSAYSQAYGGFGVALAFLSWIGILATFWVWIAAVSGVYWERKAGAQRVADMEDLSAREATSS